MRLLDPEGNQIGIVGIDEARAKAQAYGLDLVEIAAAANPPVCRILDYGKYKYELAKREKETKQNATTTKLKEVKLGYKIGDNDYLTKLRHAEEFLFEGNKVKFYVRLRGREMEHADVAVEVVKRAFTDLANVGVGDSEPKLNGRQVIGMMSPLPEQKRKLKLNQPKG